MSKGVKNICIKIQINNILINNSNIFSKSIFAFKILTIFFFYQYLHHNFKNKISEY